MTEKKSPLDQALDLFVYAPLGLALTARDELPRLIERGRTQAEAQTTMARMIGRFAVTQGQKELSKRLRPAPPPFSPQKHARTGAASAQKTTAAVSGNGAARPASSDHLAIPGYDSLAASQVVPRLAGLSSEELEAVRAYESATRNRRTIIGRIQQLQSPAD